MLDIKIKWSHKIVCLGMSFLFLFYGKNDNQLLRFLKLLLLILTCLLCLDYFLLEN